MSDIHMPENGSKLIDLTVPQFGEGIHEVRIVSINKPVGISFEQDEILYELETVKSAFSIESEFEGQVVEWLVAVGDMVAVGVPVARMQIDTGVAPVDTVLPSNSLAHEKAQRQDAAANSTGGFFIPPRTRAYAREKAVSDADLRRVVPAGRKVLPADVDKFIDRHMARSPESARMLPPAQRMQNQQFAVSKGALVTATMVAVAPYSQVRTCLKNELSACPQAAVQFVTPVQLISFYIAQVAQGTEKFRSVFQEPNAYQVGELLSLGLAVETDSKELAIAVVQDAGRLEFPQFVERVTTSVERARSGEDQASHLPQIVVSYLGGEAIVHGCPLLVTPSVATIAVGAVDHIGLVEPRISLSMTFDHRLITGMEASRFLHAVLDKLANNANAGQVVSSKLAGSRPRTKAAFAEALAQQVAELLHSPIAAQLVDESLGFLGLDSTKAKQLMAYLDDYFDESFPSTFLWHQPTISKIVDYCAQRFELADDPVVVSQPVADDFDDLLHQIRGGLVTRHS